MDIAVVYLARFAEGVEPVGRFVGSLRAFPAGVEHDRVVIRKGFPADWPGDERVSLLEAFSTTVDMDDSGVDITAYARAAEVLPHRYVLFLNPFSEIVAEDWLAKLARAVEVPGVGIAGATGSHESFFSSWREISRILWHCAHGMPYDGALDEAWGHEIAKHVPQWLEGKAALDGGTRDYDMAAGDARFLAEWNAHDFEAFRAYKAIPLFPNPHVRTNGFLMDRKTFLATGPGSVTDKVSAILYESGPSGLTRQVVERGLAPIIVGANGEQYDLQSIVHSDTFRLGTQRNLLISDNRTREWAEMPAPRQRAYSRLSFREGLLGIDAFGSSQVAMKRLTDERDALAVQCHQLTGHRDNQAAERAAIVNSLSWRLTGPLRGLKAKVGAVKRRTATLTQTGRRRLRNARTLASLAGSMLWKEVSGPLSGAAAEPANHERDRARSSVAVVYVARGHSPEERDAIGAFIQSYKTHRAGRGHELYVVFKGYEDRAALEAARRLCDVARHSFEFDDAGFDIGAYIRAAPLVTEDFLVLLNTHSTIRSDDWLEKLIRPLETKPVGLVGCTASYESLAAIDPHIFPAPPNPHVRSNAMAIDRALFVDLTRHERITSKLDAWRFESGVDSLTRRVTARNLEAVVVDAAGRTYRESAWMTSGVFRHLFRANELVADNQHRLYREATLTGKLRMSFYAWRLHDKVKEARR